MTAKKARPKKPSENSAPAQSKINKSVESIEPQTPAVSGTTSRQSGRRGWMIGALAAVVVVAFAAGFAVWPKYSQQLEGWLPAAWMPGADRANLRLDEIAGALDDIVARLAGAEAALADRSEIQALADKIGTEIAGALAQISDLQARPAAPADLAEILDATRRRLDELGAAARAAVAAPASGVGGGGIVQISAALAQLEAANRDLQVRLAKAEAGLAAVADAVAAVADAGAANAVKAANAAKAAVGDNAGAVLLAAAAQLRARTERGDDFAADLAAVKSLLVGAGAGLTAALAKIEPDAATGVATVDELARSFALIAAGLVRTAAPEQAGWAARTWARIAGLVSVRRTGEVSGDGKEARVARAESGLARRDLAAAVGEISALSSAEAIEWLTKARARLAVDDAVARLSRHAVRRMSSDLGTQ
jgi:hypothetical protein